MHLKIIIPFWAVGRVDELCFFHIEKKNFSSLHFLYIYPLQDFRLMTLNQVQGRSIRSRDAPSGPGMLHQGQGRSIRARDLPSGPGTLHEGQGPYIKAKDP